MGNRSDGIRRMDALEGDLCGGSARGVGRGLVTRRVDDDGAGGAVPHQPEDG